MYTYNVWDTIDIIFRRERRETALHHSSLSFRGNLAHQFMDLYFLCFSFPLAICNRLETY